MAKDPDDLDSAQETPSSRAVFQPLPANLVDDEVLPQLDMGVVQPPHAALLTERPAKRRRLSPPAPRADPSSGSASSSSRLLSGTSANSSLGSQPMLLPPATSLYHGGNVYIYGSRPPTAAELFTSAEQYGIPSKIYRAPYYSKESDAPERPREYAGLVFHLKGGDGIGTLEEWRSGEEVSSENGEPARALDPTGVGGWEYAGIPPSVRQVRKWLKEQKGSIAARSAPKKDSSQVLVITPLKRQYVNVVLLDRRSDAGKPVWAAKHSCASVRQGSANTAEHDCSGAGGLR